MPDDVIGVVLLADEAIGGCISSCVQTNEFIPERRCSLVLGLLGVVLTLPQV